MADGDTEHSTVLVVDDDHAVRTLITTTLRQHGYGVTMATNGRMGLEHVLAAPAQYKLILIDYRMPEMDGLTASRAIRACAPDVSVVLMSSENVEFDPEETGVREFLPKPFDSMDLIDLVDRHLDI